MRVALKLLIAFIAFLVSTTNPKKSYTLRSVTNQLSQLARVTNGFSLQSELSNDPKKFSAITSELLGIGSNTLLDTLLAVDATTVAKDLNTLFDGIQKATISNVDTVQVGEKISAIQSMTGKVGDLKKGTAANVSDVQSKLSDAITDFKYNDLNIADSSKFTNALSIMLSKEIIAKGTETVKNELMLQTIKDGITSFRINLPKLADTTVFGKFWELKDTYENVLKPIMTVSEIAISYNKDVLKPELLAKDLDLMTNDVKALTNLITLSQKDTNGAQMVKIAQEIEASLKLAVTRSLTSGFVNGASDIQLIFKDLRGSWLKKNIGNGGSIDKIAVKLQKLKTFAGKVVPLHSNWMKLANNSTSRNSAKIVSALLDQAQVSSKRVQSTAALMHSFKKIKQSVSNLTPVTLHARLGDFEKFCKTYEEFDKTMKTMKTLFESVKNSEYVGKLAALEPQIDAVISTSDSDALVAQEVAALRNLSDISNIATFFNQTLTAWNSIDFLGIQKTLKNVDGWDLAKQIQMSLNDTGLLPALTSIKNLKFDANATDSFVKFAGNIRGIQSKSAEVTGTKTFLADLSAVVTTGKTAKSSTQLSKNGTRSKRQAPVNLDSHVAHQLGSAVQVLQNMAVVSEKKGKILGLANAKASVTTAVEAVAKDVWTVENREAMKSTVDEVEKLEKFVQKLGDDDWDTLVKVFDEAAKVKGVPIDSKMFSDPIGVALEKSTDSDVKAAAVDFRDLSTLDLDFASKERDLKTASLTLNPIRDFFDQLLGISRISQVNQVIQTVTQEPVDLIWYYVGTPVGAVLLVGLTLVATWIYWLKRERKLKRQASKKHKRALEHIKKASEEARKIKEDNDRKAVENKLAREEEENRLKKVNKDNEDLKKKLLSAQGQLVQAKDEARVNQIEGMENADRADKAEAREAKILAGLLELTRGYMKIPANRMAFFFNHAHELRGAKATKSNCIFKAVEEGDHDNLRELTNVKGLPLDTFHFHDGEYKTALMLACEKRDSTAMNMLLEAGANPILIGSQRLSAERILERQYNVAKLSIEDQLDNCLWPVKWIKKKKRYAGDTVLEKKQDEKETAERMLKDLNGYQNKDQVQKSLPDFLPTTQYRFAVDRKIPESAKFVEMFSTKIYTGDGPTHTHRISPTDVYELEGTIDSLIHLLEPQPLLKPSYITACVADPKLLGDDYMYRVTELKWRDKVYDLVDLLKFYSLGHGIPPMNGYGIKYVGIEDIEPLARLLGFTLSEDHPKAHWFVYGNCIKEKEMAKQECDLADNARKDVYSIDQMINTLLKEYKKVDVPTAHKGTEAEIKKHIEAEKAQRDKDWKKLMKEKEKIDEKDKRRETDQIFKSEIASD